MDWNLGFGARVAEARRRLGLTQTQLGRLLGWSDGQQALSKYERGASTPSPFRLAALASALRVTVADLLDQGAAHQLAEAPGQFTTIGAELSGVMERLSLSSQAEVLAFARRLA